MDKCNRMRVAILGTGIVGMDLLVKIARSEWLDCRLVVGRNATSEGMAYAASLGYPSTDRGVDALIEAPDTFDIVFDATNVDSHRQHYKRLAPLGKRIFDLTPSKIGRMVLPSINGGDVADYDNINLISCGGQATIPLMCALGKHYPDPAYVEIVTTPASPGVGRATRLNLDEYIYTTEAAICAFTTAKKVKVAVNISAARPPTSFRVSMSMLVPGADVEVVRSTVEEAACGVRAFCPGYRIAACTVLDDSRIFVATEIVGRGDRLPAYAGNLDIINGAAVFVAEQYARDRLVLSGHYAPPFLANEAQLG